MSRNKEGDGRRIFVGVSLKLKDYKQRMEDTTRGPRLSYGSDGV